MLLILPPMFKPVLQQMRLQGILGGGGKMCNFAIQLILQQ